MMRRCLLLLAVLTVTTIPSGGCRSCSSCHDYDPPVMGCECGGWGHRAGSACGCESCGTGGCDGCGCDETQGEYGGQFVPYEGQMGPPDPSEQPIQEEVGA